MTISKRNRFLVIRAFLLSVFFVALTVAAAPQGGNIPQAAASKLTTVLQDLAGVVPQSATGAVAPAQAAPLDVNTLPRSVQDAIHSRLLRINSANEVQVYVLMTPVTNDRVQALTAAGVTVEIADATAGRVQARIPVSSLQAIAALDFVDFIRMPSYAVHHEGSVTTEGDAIIHSDAVRNEMSLDGTGVRVGVLSDGLKGVFASSCTTCGGVAGGPISTRDLPSAAGTRNTSGVLTSSAGGIIGRSFQANQDLEGKPTGACSFAGAGAEGTALLEIVHDVAPSAQLSFANADTDLAFNQAVNFLASTNDVVVDDLGFFGFPYDGTSSVSTNTANALNNASFPIRAYVTSVGNETTGHYLGGYVNSGVDALTVGGVTTAGHLHLFQSAGDTTDVLGLGSQPYDLIQLPNNGEVVIFLTWDDPFGKSSNNYDLYLIQQSGNRVVARSTDLQTGTQDPVEVLDYVNTGASGFFEIAVQNVRDAAQPRNLNIYSFEPECATDGPRLLAPNHHERHNYNTPSHSVIAQSDSGGSPVSVISVGAICSASAAAQAVFAGGEGNESCNDRSNSTIEFYSSRGPTIDGRTKPDISAIDGVSITGAGSFDKPFFGTSAAGPHVAGEAALALQGIPCFIRSASNTVDPATARSKLRTLLLQTADSVTGGLVPDNTFGYGRADALAALTKTLPTFQGKSSVTVSGNTPGGANVTGAALGFVDPNGCSVSKLSWKNGCGSSPGSTMNCPFGTSTVSVSGSNNGLAFSSPVDVTVTVTNFGVSASPASATVRQGQSASYQVTVTPQGGAFTDSVTLACTNLPQGAACNFSPSSLSPGSGSVQSTLTISTSAQATTVGSRWPATIAPIGVVVLVIGLASWFVAGAGVRFGVPDFARVAPIALLGIVVLLLPISCGGSGGSPLPPLNSPGAVPAPTSLTFGNQATGSTSAAQTVTLTNNGTAALTISGIATSGDFAQTNGCSASLAAGASCSISITFTPTASGSRSGALTITDNAANSPQTVALTGASASGATPPGTYQVSVVGTAGTLVQNSGITIVVQ
jgi:hypothetical protein